jgi:hypothetical protein
MESDTDSSNQLQAKLAYFSSDDNSVPDAAIAIAAAVSHDRVSSPEESSVAELQLPVSNGDSMPAQENGKKEVTLLRSGL